MSDIVRTIRNGLESEISAEAGVNYKKLDYLEDVSKNSLRTSSLRYGVRALDSEQLPGVTKYMTFQQSFEIVLSKSYRESVLGDSPLFEASLDNDELMMRIYKRLINNKAGVPASVLNVTDLTLAQPEVLADEKVVVTRATVNILYRLTLI